MQRREDVESISGVNISLIFPSQGAASLPISLALDKPIYTLILLFATTRNLHLLSGRHCRHASDNIVCRYLCTLHVSQMLLLRSDVAPSLTVRVRVPFQQAFHFLNVGVQIPIQSQKKTATYKFWTSHTPASPAAAFTTIQDTHTPPGCPETSSGGSSAPQTEARVKPLPTDLHYLVPWAGLLPR